MKRTISTLLAVLLTVTLLPSAFASGEATEEAAVLDTIETEEASEETPETPEEAAEEVAELPATDGADSTFAGLDNTHWSYDSANKVWYQIGVSYCANPVNTTYETLGIYVPGAYMTGTKNSGGYYTCTVNAGANVGSYTSDNAPFVMPVNTPGYSAQKAPTSYSYKTVSSYVSQGMIYVYAGCRGKGVADGGAPWGVTDLKAAIRFIRYSDNVLPGNTEYFFAFGHSGGGAQTSVLGTSGNSALYTPYLESLGACMTYDDGGDISDAICGAMAWCPITSLDMADAAYEWNLGQYARTGSAQDLSYDLADAYAAYINSLGLTDGHGNKLTLARSDSYEYAAGSYYDFLLSEIERSRQNYIADKGSTPAEQLARYGLDVNDWYAIYG